MRELQLHAHVDVPKRQKLLSSYRSQTENECFQWYARLEHPVQSLPFGRYIYKTKLASYSFHYDIARIFASSNSIARACYIFPLSTLMTSINCTSSSCELSNPPKTSPKCIHNLKVHDQSCHQGP